MESANYQGLQKGHWPAKVFAVVEIQAAAASQGAAEVSVAVAWTRRPWEEAVEAESEAEVALKGAIVVVAWWRIPSSCCRWRPVCRRPYQIRSWSERQPRQFWLLVLFAHRWRWARGWRACFE